jgi:hypothetical protein
MDLALFELLRDRTDRDDEEIEATVRLDRADSRVGGVRIVS